MSQFGVKQPGDTQMPANTADATQCRLRKGGSHSNKILTVGELLYQLTGLLVLQRLYTDVLDEKRRLEAATLSNMGSKSQPGGNNSLFSPLYRSMHLQLTKYEQMMVDIEGKTAKGLIQVLTITLYWNRVMMPIPVLSYCRKTTS